MAVYKLFPEKDATLYSEYPTMNTGIDQILEMSSNESATGEYHATRALVKFSTDSIQDTVNNLIVGNAFEAYLKLRTAKVTGLNQEVLLEVNPISGSWANGTGMYLDRPETVNGVSWVYTTPSGPTPWATGGFDPYVTASYPTSTPGGGCWYTQTPIGLLLTQTASLAYRRETDLSIKVTDTIDSWISGAIENEGFIVRQSQGTEFLEEPGKNLELKYFSVDTNTIYPPELELRWDDSVRNTGSLAEVSTADLILTLSNNTDNYDPGTIKQFRLNVRPQFPVQTFTTGSIYTTNNILPEDSHWSIQDLYTNETVVDFDTAATKISCDNAGNFFTVYMDGLEPERYYKILVKTVINGSTRVIDNQQYFKVVNR